ncbi:MAG: ABC transporter ATP-binding protein [Proteobacteria bacterium]|nr:ABC transporter ATP-binding protein [Pseudomonadota bacterium]
MSPMIELWRVSKRFEGRAALDELTLSVAQGQTLALLGPSGSGKTTTLRLINRLVEPDGGAVLFQGQNVREVDPVTLRRRIGYVIQDAALFPHLTAGENVALVPRLLGWAPARLRARVEELFAWVDLPAEAFAGRYPAQLSGGQGQRVALARALAADPEVVLMDEPFSALDTISRRRLEQQFLAIKRELRKTIVLVTHNIGEAFRLADQVAVLAEGRLQALGTPAELRAEPGNELVSDLLRSLPGLEA